MTVLPVVPWWAALALSLIILGLVGWAAFRAVRSGRPRTPWVLRSLLAVCLVAAAWRPGIPGAEAQGAVNDLNVFFVVDLTTSASAEDYGGRPRLDGVRADMEAIADRLAGAKFAVLTFDTKGAVRMPLTTDTAALEATADVMRPAYYLYSKGSSISAGADVLKARLEASAHDSPERARIVFYLGDGEQTSPQPAAPFGIDRSLISGGAVLGYGTESGGRMLENSPRESENTGYIKDPTTGADALSRIDEGALRGIAGQLGVPYVHRAPGDAVDAALVEAQPGALKASEESGLFGRFELYWAFALVGFVLVLAEVVRSGAALAELRPRRREKP
jgi:Ca-activated chloride channel family protein